MRIAGAAVVTAGIGVAIAAGARAFGRIDELDASVRMLDQASSAAHARAAEDRARLQRIEDKLDRLVELRR